MNRLTYLENRTSEGTVISSYAYTLDAAGNRTKVVEHSGRVVEYTYDDTYKLREEKITNPDSSVSVISYTYDTVGNRKTKTENGFTTTYTYNDNNQLVTEDDITYSYDDNGNLKAKNSAEETVEYFYDAENHLTRVETTRFSVTIVVEYEYDAEGHRVRKVIDGTVVTNYLVDTNRDYAQVLEERDGSGNLLVRYVYGHDLISQTRGGATTYYHYDGLGSTRALTSSAEAVTDTYTYDSFGLILEQTGTTENNYLYRGEQFDPELGFYYLRARYMDPNVGRFVTMDAFAGSIHDPYTLHKYLYANANPITYSDPSGNFSIMETQIGQLIRGLLDRYNTVMKIAKYRVMLGTLGTAVYKMVDTKLGGGTWQDVLYSGAVGAAEGFVSEMIGLGAGHVIGKVLSKIPTQYLTRLPPYLLSNLCKIVALGPIIVGGYHLKQEIRGIMESIEKGEYDQAAWRSLRALHTVYGMIITWKSAACFTEETLIYTKEGYKPIKDIKVGDNVYAEDVSTGEKGVKRVAEIFVRETKTLVYIFLDDVEIKATPDHPFWVPGKGWVHAGNLQIEDDVKLYFGKQGKITGIRQEVLTWPIKVYNLKIEGWHTYFVSKKNILVHNANYTEGDLYESIEKVMVEGGDCDYRSKSLKSKLGKGQLITLLPKEGDLLARPGLPNLPWHYHTAVLLPDDQVADPLLGLVFPSVDEFKNYILINPNSVKRMIDGVIKD